MTPNLLKAYLNKKRIHNQAWTALLSSKRPSIGEISHRTNMCLYRKGGYIVRWTTLGRILCEYLGKHKNFSVDPRTRWGFTTILEMLIFLSISFTFRYNGRKH